MSDWIGSPTGTTSGVPEEWGFKEQLDYITNVLTGEGRVAEVADSTASQTELWTLANQALDIISETVRPLAKLWAGSSLTGETEGVWRKVSLPTDLIGPPCVRYSTKVLTHVGEDWREHVGEFEDNPPVEDIYWIAGQYLYTNLTSNPDIRGYTYLPRYTEKSANPNTMDSMLTLPASAYYLPAFYALAYYRSAPDVDTERQRVATYSRLWAEGLDRLARNVAELSGSPYHF